MPRTLKNGQPSQWCSSSPFIAQGGKTVHKKVRQNIPFHSKGIFPLILGRVRLMGLSSHLRTNNYVPSHMDVHPSAHPLYTLRILRCISSTIQFTLVTINKIQIQHVDVQRCTFRVCLFRSGFRLWTKIFTTTYHVL